MNERDRLLMLDDSKLLAHCRTDVFRGSGHGGQKRNVTDSAVRVTHAETGICAQSDESRSQIQNRRTALRELRRELAFQMRAEPPAEWPWKEPPGKRAADYVRWLAAVLDLLEACQYQVSSAAAVCGRSTARLVRDLAADPDLWREVNRHRAEHSLSPLRMPRN